MIDWQSWANSSGVPNREGNGICAASDSRASSGRPAAIGVSNNPGAIVQTRIPNLASSRAMGSVIATTPPLDAE